MKRMDRLQKLLYLIMAVLGIYILYKGSALLLKKGDEQGAFEAGTVQRTLEDAALRTYLPGYTAVVEEYDAGSWMSSWMQQVVPVYSYVANGEQDGDGTSEAEEKQTGQSISEAEEKQDEQSVSEAEEKQDGQSIPEAEEKQDGQSVPEAEQGNQETGSQAATDLKAAQEESAVPASAYRLPDTLLEHLQDFDYLLSNYYIVDSGTSADADLLDADTLLNTDLSIAQNPAVPQILIYHTHSQEAFADSQEGNVDDTIVGMGEVLKEELEKFGYQVIHDTGVYDLVDGVLDRSAAYDYARESVEQILEEHPTIEVIIDLHRDGVEGQKFVTEIDGKPASMIMFFNGISRNSSDEPLYWLENPYITENLAFTLQLQLKAREQYPGFTRNIYLKAERFNLHLRPRSLLIEAGTQLNTVEEERNAMAPLADLITQVLSGQ